MHPLKASGWIHVPDAPFGFEDKPFPVGGNILLCISCHYIVILTHKSNTTGIIYWLFIQHCSIGRAVHITQLSLLTNSGVKLLRNSDNYYCEKEWIRKLPGTIKNIGSNTKLECKINGITQGKMKQWLVVKELAVQILQCNIGHRK